MSATPTSRKMVEEHDKLYRLCFSWLRDAKHSNIKSEVAILRAHYRDPSHQVEDVRKERAYYARKGHQDLGHYNFYFYISFIVWK